MPMPCGEKSQPIYKQAAVSYCLRLFCFCRFDSGPFEVDFFAFFGNEKSPVRLGTPSPRS